MPITLGSNIASLKALRKLSDTTSALSKNYERLSSGLRINSAKDDAAGLAIAESLNSDRRIFTQGIRNLNDGLSVLNIADSAIQSLSEITIRLKELAEQSSNGVYSAKQRSALDKEAQALSKEYTRIIQSTSFNGKQLFSSSYGNLNLQAGVGANNTLSSNFGGAISNGTYTTPATYTGLDIGPTPLNYTAQTVLGDLNGDGVLDMAFAGDDGGFLVVRLGTGSGSFGSAVCYTFASGVTGIDIGDLNNDGKQDLIISNNTQSISMLGNGNGTFSNFRTYSGISAQDIALGDLNTDGVLDYISVGGGSTEIRFGIGDGSFGAASFLASSINIISLELGDVNGDGILDLAGAGNAGGQAKVEVRLGNGNGSFLSSATFSLGNTQAKDLKLGDLNGDGLLDIAAAGYGVTGFLEIILNQGQGTFSIAQSFSNPTGTLYAGLDIGDLNGDGNLDIVTVGNPNQIYIGSGNGSFSAGISFLTAGETNAVTLGDLNGDGVADIVTSEYDGDTLFALVRLANTTTGNPALLPFSLTTKQDSLDALTEFNKSLNRLSAQRSIIGSFQSRVEVAVNVLESSRLNYQAAENRIRDADIAQETAEMVRNQILQKSAMFILAQANQQPQIVLKLLGGSLKKP